MFLDSQKQFQEQMNRHIHGEALHLEPGYKEAYAEWEVENKETIYQWSAEERTQSFADFLEKKVHARLIALVGDKQELKELANRGQLLLASKDGGKTFDTFLTPEDETKVNPMDYVLLSPTFRSTTTNFKEVREEQALVHIVSKLRDQHYGVNHAWIENGVVHVDALHPLRGTYEVQVDLDQSTTLPLNYKFINAEGTTEVPETQLPEEFGLAEQDITLQVPSETEALMMDPVNDDKNKRKLAVLAASTAAWIAAQQAGAKQGPSSAELATEQARNQMVRHEAGSQGAMSLPNVMASKAHFARQNQGLEGSKKREAQRFELAKEKEREYAKRKQEEQRKRQEENKQSQKRLAQGAAAGAGILGGVLSAFAGSSLFLGHISNLNNL